MHTDVSALFDLRGQVALVTGGARDLGLDAASILAAAGCNVAITSRSPESAKAAADRLAGQYGVEARGFELDQTQFENVARVMAEVRAWQGRVDVLVNNAGGSSGKSKAWLFDRDPGDIASLIETNLTGAIYCCREIGRAMAQRHSGRIINIASIAALVGRDRRIYDRSGMNGQPVDYAAAKAGVLGLTRDLAAMLGPHGVNVNAVSPGGFARNQPGTFIPDYSELTALGRMGRDGIDLKGAILFLASPASDYVTGQNLVVDGGFSIWR
jgi:NAD(P)-dependent dehydrogenase (short-subunit alcohol dehydrogenase family)